ncbi:galactarate dehydratase [Fusobacterium sp. PH5-44]|uniref:galactarate dehydratase n=1 Tax=unclassified Fusobacterium TaxID=2648384 RepID=UPI003D23E2EB
MEKLSCIKIKEIDNVAIAVRDIEAGTKVFGNVTTIDNIPQAHKIALVDIPQNTPIIRYGVILGYAVGDIKQGQWINENMLVLPVPPSVEDMEFATDITTELPSARRTTWLGYRNPNGGYAGTRNILGINTTVQCVTGVLNRAIERIKKELLPKYPNVDGVVGVNHAYGCGVAINAPEAVIPIRILRNISKHPNFGGQMMVVGLGCEKLTVEMLCDDADINQDNVIILQDKSGYNDMIDSIVKMAESKLKILNERKREELPLSDLLIGLQCGGSDAFSGITANPAAGYASDMLISGGATVLFSEVTEVRDGVYILGHRCINEEVGRKLAAEMKWYDRYLDKGGVDRSANPTPGNKKGGLANIVEKAMGSIAKSGSSPIIEVLSPGEKPSKKGLIYAATPASDIVCGPCQLASGIGLQVFMTGRGTPYGLAVAPVIKVSSRSDIKDQWFDLIDVNAGTIATGDSTIKEVGKLLFEEILNVASGLKKSFAEEYQLYNDFCIFNPAPIT